MDITKDADGKLYKTDVLGRLYLVDRSGTRLTAKTDRPESVPGSVWMKLKQSQQAKLVEEHKKKGVMLHLR